MGQAILNNSEFEKEQVSQRTTTSGPSDPPPYFNTIALLRFAAVALQNPGTLDPAHEIALIGHLAYRAEQIEQISKGRASLVDFITREGLVPAQDNPPAPKGCEKTLRIVRAL